MSGLVRLEDWYEEYRELSFLFQSVACKWWYISQSKMTGICVLDARLRSAVNGIIEMRERSLFNRVHSMLSSSLRLATTTFDRHVAI